MAKTTGKPATPGMNMGVSQVAPREGNPAEEAMAALHGAKGMTQTRTQYQTAIAVHVPRVLDTVKRRVIEEAMYAGEDFFYAWTQKDKNSSTGQGLIEGTSIEGAMILIRNWGNAVCEPDIVDETPTHWMLRATFIDLETGFSGGRLFRQRKNQKSAAKMDDERGLDIAFQVGQSKAIRNAIVRAVPKWLVDEALEAAKSAAAKQYSDMAESSARAIDGFTRDYGVTLAQLERKLGKKRVDWIPPDIVMLRAIFKALREGMTSVGQEFSDDAPATSDVIDAPVEEVDPFAPVPKAEAVAIDAAAAQAAATAHAPAIEPLDNFPAKPAEPKPDPVADFVPPTAPKK